jgi:hypothetical protein
MSWPRISALPKIDVEGFSLHKEFETRKKAKAEDRVRVRLIEGLLDNPDRIVGVEVSSLRRLLDNIRAANSPASAVYMRKHRKRFIPQMYQLICDGDYQVSAFTVIPPRWEVAAGRLQWVEPRKLREAFRQMVGHHHEGWMAVALHGEFEPTKGVYQLHLHGFACGHYLNAIDGLRHRPSLQVQPDDDGVKSIAKPVRIVRKLKGNLSSPLGYMVQSFWPERGRFKGADGKLKRVRLKHRIASPQHEEVLLWLDRSKLSDLILFMGLQVTHLRLASVHYSTHNLS